MIQDYEFQYPGQPYPLDYYRQINNRDFLYEHSYDDEKIQVQYGHVHEINAIRDYESLYGYKVTQTGLWLFPSGYVTCSPDGLIYTRNKRQAEGMIEVKCPAQLQYARCERANTWYRRLDYLKPGNQINNRHRLYHRLQAEMYATGTKWCDLVVWSPHDILITRIERNEAWIQEKVTLIDTFFERFCLESTHRFHEIQEIEQNKIENDTD